MDVVSICYVWILHSVLVSSSSLFVFVGPLSIGCSEKGFGIILFKDTEFFTTKFSINSIISDPNWYHCSVRPASET